MFVENVLNKIHICQPICQRYQRVAIIHAPGTRFKGIEELVAFSNEFLIWNATACCRTQCWTHYQTIKYSSARWQQMAIKAKKKKKKIIRAVENLCTPWCLNCLLLTLVMGKMQKSHFVVWNDVLSNTQQVGWLPDWHFSISPGLSRKGCGTSESKFAQTNLRRVIWRANLNWQQWEEQ